MEMSGILCLKWNNHTTTFIHSLDGLRLKESYCDATIACCGRYYPVHRFVLGTCSDYFEEIFDRTPCKHPFIILKDVNSLQFEALLNYMYKGEVNVLQESLPDLIRAAEALKVKGLTVSEDNKLSQEPEEKNEVPLSSIIIKERGKGSREIHSSTITDEAKIGKAGAEIEFEPSLNDLSSQLGQNLTSGDTDKQSDISNISKEINGKITCSNREDIDNDLENDSKKNSSIVNGFEIAQCSAWSDNLACSDELSKEALQSSWIQSSDYDSLSLDPLHYLTNGAVSPSYSSSAPDDLSSDTKEKTRDKTVRTKTGSGPKYQCIECSFKTNDKAAFRLHEMRKHTGEKPFACSMCSYRCTTKDMLKIHTRKHTGERPFSCPYCTCKMAVKSSLKRHILLKHIQPRKTKSRFSATPDSLITTGTVKAYKCSFCSYESQMKSNLKLHCMRIHTGEKPIACAICPYRTTTKPQLEKHMRKHTGEKPFSCTFCSYKAAQKHSLLRHMSLHVK